MIIAGKSRYAMVLGEPRVNKFDPDNRLWSIDVLVDKDVLKKLKTEGLGWKIRETEDTKESYIKFKKNELTRDGDKNDPIEVIDGQGKPWDHKKLIGNGSEINVRFRTYEGFKKQTQTAIDAIQVVKHVPYETDKEDFPTYPAGTQDVYNNEGLTHDDIFTPSDDDEIA